MAIENNKIVNLADAQVLYNDLRGRTNSLEGKKANGENLYLYKEASGDVITVDDAVAEVVKQMRIEIAPVQSGSGDPSPENVRPITGWTGAKVTRTGKNLKIKMVKGYFNDNASTINIDNDSESVVFYAVKGTTYTVSSNVALDRSYIARTNTTNIVHGTPIYDIQSLSIISMTWTATWTGVTIWYVYSSANTTVHNTTQVEIGSSATDYEEPIINEYTLTFPTAAGTVYGGTLTLNQDGTGKLVVDKASVLTDSTMLRYDTDISAISTTNNILAFWIYSALYPDHNMANGFLLCDKLKARPTVSTIVISSIFGTNAYPKSYGFMLPINTCDATASAIRAYLNANPYQIVFELATPATYDLTTQQVSLLLGLSNVWADCGAIESLLYATDNKAEKTGEYEHLTAGSAENLLSAYTEESVPYVYRQTPLASKRVREKLVGGTVAWNQKANITSVVSYHYSKPNVVPVVSYNDGVYSVTTESVGSETALETGSAIAPTVSCVVGHKYLNSIDVKVTKGKLNILNTYYSSEQRIANNVSATGKFESFTCIYNAQSNNEIVFNIRMAELEDNQGSYEFKNVQCFDITVMFGPTIADAIYAMETATAGSGVALFRGLFPKDYYAYDSGTLMSVQASRKKIVGKNLLKPSTNRSFTSNGITWTPQSDGTVIANGTATADSYWPIYIPNNLVGNYYFNGGTSNDSAIADIYVWNSTKGERAKQWDGTTASISSVSENIAAKVQLTGKESLNCRVKNGKTVNGLVFKPMVFFPSTSDYSYEPYQEYTYPFDTSLVLRGIPKLDSNNRMYYDGDEYQADGKVERKYKLLTNQTASVGDTITLTGAKSNLTDIITSKGHLADVGTISGTTLTLTVALNNDDILYELATPTTEQAAPYQEIQICDTNGTEEFIDAGNRDVSVPVGGDRQYYKDIVSAIKGIPAAPSSNGTYVLKVTVSSGVPTYSWVSE